MDSPLNTKMSTPSALALTPREAVTDALHRAILGLDSNNRALFESACLTTEEMQWIGGGYAIMGWEDISALFERVFNLITTHVISNVRVSFLEPDDDGEVREARLTAHAVSYHVRQEDKESVEGRSFTGYSLYDLVIVKRGDGNDGWKIKRWTAEVLRTTGDRSIVHG
jgi:hypothetical protein